ncbi:hypothetical protein EYF80_033544 [Liparis tanakae]|uniref:Uncharacterized protein n=1 Tax=Liparis tanakae TaxID=230148 RepID=A0A4Z2GSG4_9TELE|nr:hypothetical protein EYF80_033544 [Liparis tanakae]
MPFLAGRGVAARIYHIAVGLAAAPRSVNTRRASEPGPRGNAQSLPPPLMFVFLPHTAAEQPSSRSRALAGLIMHRCCLDPYVGEGDECVGVAGANDRPRVELDHPVLESFIALQVLPIKTRYSVPSLPTPQCAVG